MSEEWQHLLPESCPSPSLPRAPSFKLLQTPQLGVHLPPLDAGSTPRSCGHCFGPNEVALSKCGCAQSFINHSQLPSAMDSTCYYLWLVSSQDCWGPHFIPFETTHCLLKILFSSMQIRSEAFPPTLVRLTICVTPGRTKSNV